MPAGDGSDDAVVERGEVGDLMTPVEGAGGRSLNDEDSGTRILGRVKDIDVCRGGVDVIGLCVGMESDKCYCHKAVI